MLLDVGTEVGTGRERAGLPEPSLEAWDAAPELHTNKRQLTCLTDYPSIMYNLCCPHAPRPCPPARMPACLSA